MHSFEIGRRKYEVHFRCDKQRKLNSVILKPQYVMDSQNQRLHRQFSRTSNLY
jgi:hypothetical protein